MLCRPRTHEGEACIFCGGFARKIWWSRDEPSRREALSGKSADEAQHFCSVSSFGSSSTEEVEAISSTRRPLRVSRSTPSIGQFCVTGATAYRQSDSASSRYQVPAGRKHRRRNLEESSVRFVHPNGDRSDWISCPGEFDKVVFALDVPDIDWVPGGGAGVSLDLAAHIDDSNGLIRMLHQLADHGWTSGTSRWRIKQSGVNWHGTGAHGFAQAIANWEARYAGVMTCITARTCAFKMFATTASTRSMRRYPRRGRDLFTFVTCLSS